MLAKSIKAYGYVLKFVSLQLLISRKYGCIFFQGFLTHPYPKLGFFAPLQKLEVRDGKG